MESCVAAGCVEYQHLHSDGMISSSGEHAKDFRDAPTYGGFHDPSGSLHFRDLPCPMVNVNYPMELVRFENSDVFRLDSLSWCVWSGRL